MTATRSTVSMASDGWCDHQASVLVIFSVRTFRLGSDNGSSLTHLVKARTAKVVGMRWASHGLTVEGQTSRLEGSNAGVGGGVGPVELFMRARWVGVVAGLDADGPVLGGVEVSEGSSPARWRSSANWFLSWVISCWVSGSVVRAATQL